MIEETLSGGAALILSVPEDESAWAVQWGLRRNRVTPVWIPSLSDHAANATTLSIRNDAPLAMQWPYSSHAFRSVWYRRPQRPVAPAATCAQDREFVADEWRALQDNVAALSVHALPALWVNDPAAARRAENKLVQLEAARSIGLKFPDTLASNDPERVRRFIREHGAVVVKTFLPYAWSGEDERPAQLTSVSIVDSAQSLDDASIAMCPAIYQQIVDKVCDIRVTIVGNRLFPVRLTAASGGAHLDWRPSTFLPDLVTEACRLPSAIEDKLLKLQARLGLVTGCVDLAIDRDGECHFFEVNQGGQFLFVERLSPQTPVLRAMCAMLAQGRVDYSLDAAANISHAEFQRTDDHERWHASHLAMFREHLANTNLLGAGAEDQIARIIAA